RNGNGCFPSAIATERNGLYPNRAPRKPAPLAASAAAGPEALDLSSLGGRDVVGAPPHLSHQALFLDLPAKLAERLLEVLRVLDDYLQKPITSYFQPVPTLASPLPTRTIPAAHHRRAGETSP